MQSVYRRPLIIDLNPFHFPITAIVSILHRISGFFLVLIIPFALCGLDESLKSEQSFILLKESLNKPFFSFLLWLTLISLGAHGIFGIRHIIMDLHYFDSKRGGTIGAYVVLVLAFILAIALGGILWTS